MATIAGPLPIFVDNRELLERFRRGEREALARVYDHYVSDVALLVRRGFSLSAPEVMRVPGAHDIETEHELIQETFVKAFAERARTTFDGVRPYRPFLLRITKNAMIDRFRARRREASYGGGAGVGDLDALLEENAELPAGEDDEGLDWKRRLEAAQAFIASLDPESRELVRARFERELSQDAAAESIGCSRRRVRTLESRVQRDLRRYLRRRGLLDS